METQCQKLNRRAMSSTCITHQFPSWEGGKRGKRMETWYMKVDSLLEWSRRWKQVLVREAPLKSEAGKTKRISFRLDHIEPNQVLQGMALSTSNHEEIGEQWVPERICSWRQRRIRDHAKRLMPAMDGDRPPFTTPRQRGECLLNEN